MLAFKLTHRADYPAGAGPARIAHEPRTTSRVGFHRSRRRRVRFLRDRGFCRVSRPGSVQLSRRPFSWRPSRYLGVMRKWIWQPVRWLIALRSPTESSSRTSDQARSRPECLFRSTPQPLCVFRRVRSSLAASAGFSRIVMVIAGNFSAINGVPRTKLAHVLSDGSLDLGFEPTIALGGVEAMAVAGSTLYVGGDFSQVNGQTRSSGRFSRARASPRRIRTNPAGARSRLAALGQLCFTAEQVRMPNELRRGVCVGVDFSLPKGVL